MSEMVMTSISEFIKELGPAAVNADVPMSNHTSLHMGGSADIYITPQDVDIIALALRMIDRSGLPSLPLGGGTNLLVRDNGIEGVVISLSELSGIATQDEDDESVLLDVGAGQPLQELLRHMKSEGLSGLEGLAGIPGTLGGAIAGNAGSFKYEIKDVIKSVDVMDITGSITKMSANDMGFSYRQCNLPAGGVIVGATLRLKKTEPGHVGDLMKKYLKMKTTSQPIGSRSAGCVFKNPADQPAGMLIDKAGCKGMSVGGVEVSTVHSNFFINKNNGTSDDFLRLMDNVSQKVREAFKVDLEPEIKVVGRC